MPFPWKRVKSAKLSRLVNNHLHISQKRRDGSSLVVETGFPTSLIDLFIKNRDKLKKSSRKKRHSPSLSPSAAPTDQVIVESPGPFSSPLIPPYPTISTPMAGLPDPLIACPPSLPNSSLLPLISGDSGESVGVGSSDGDASVGVERILFVFLKMFVVVFLALRMRRLTAGITISAFLLLFLEFLEKHALEWLRPDSSGVLKWTIRKVRLLLKFKEVLELPQVHTSKLDSYSSKSVESLCLNQEIQNAEAKDYLLTCVEEIESENEITAESGGEATFRCQEIEYTESVMEKADLEVTKIKSPRAKIKMKMKKLFRKKSSSRKEYEPQILEIVKKSVLCDEQEVECLDDGELESVRESISRSRNINKEDVNLCFLGGLAEVNEETATNSQEKGGKIKSKSTWIYLVLCLIVLVGLIGGRSFAILLTLSWCLLLKLGENLPSYIKTG